MARDRRVEKEPGTLRDERGELTVFEWAVAVGTVGLYGHVGREMVMSWSWKDGVAGQNTKYTFVQKCWKFSTDMSQVQGQEGVVYV